MIGGIVEWFADPSQWSGSGGIPQQLLTHIAYSLGALAIACAVAVPLGSYIGHTGRGRFAAVNIVGGFRAIPSLGVLLLAVLIALPRLQGDGAFLVPSLVVLVLLAIPPVLSGVYAGIGAVDPSARDAARGMGMTGWQTLVQVELPCALPLIMSGIRASLIQVVATATMAAVVSLGGLGRFLIDGLAARDYSQMAAGALLVALLALGLDLVLAGVQRLTVSPGLRSGRVRSRGRRFDIRSRSGAVT